MYSIHDRDDLEKLKKLQETRSLLHKETIKEKLGKQDFHYDMEEVFEPVTFKQQELSEKQILALRDSTSAASQTTVQAIENQTQAIRESSNTLNKNLQKSIKEGLQEYDEITNRNNQLLTNLVNSNQVDSSIVKTVSNLLNDKNKSQFSLEPTTQDNPRSSTNLFTINPSNPQQVKIKNTTLIFLGSGNLYDLINPDLHYFITNTQFDRQLQNVNTIFNFLNDMNYNIINGDKKSMRYYFINDLIKQYYQQSAEFSTELPNQVGTGLNGEAARSYARSNSQSYTNQYVFLPSDPGELVDHLKLLYFEKLGRNDSFLLNEQIIAIVDKLLENECITTNQHQNILSNFDSTSV